MSDRDARIVSASSACGALALGFSIGAIVTAKSARLRNVNLALAAGLGLSAAALRMLSKDDVPPAPVDPAIETHASDPAIDYSIIIPVYNRPGLISNLLDVLREQASSWTDLGRGEIVIVDDGSVDETAAVARAHAERMPIPARVLSIPHRGPGQARNAGFAEASGRIGVSIDSDCLPHTNWLPGLLHDVRAQPMTAAFARVRSAEKLSYPIENAPDRKGYVSASFAMDREAFCRLGGFYKAYGMSHEDLDFVETAKLAAFEVVRSESDIDHPLRIENAKSIWRVGLNSKYANLFVRRHGRRASGITRTTPYYFFGIGGNYGSSIAFVTTLVNVAAALLFALGSPTFRKNDLALVSSRLAFLSALYMLALAALGLRVGAGVKRLPHYVSTLAAFQLATLIGRIKGSVEYGSVLL